MQVPGGEVGVQERGVEPAGLEAVQQLFARFEASHRVVLLRDGHRAGHDPDPFAAKVGQGMDAVASRAGPPARTGRRHRERSRPHRAAARTRAAGRAPRHSGRRAGNARRTARWHTSEIRSSAPECGPRAAPRPHPGPAVYRPGLCRSGASRPVWRRRSGPSPAAGAAPTSGSVRRARSAALAATQGTDEAISTRPDSSRVRLLIWRPREGRRRTGCCRGGRCGATGRRRRRIPPSSRPSPRTRRCTAGRRGCR